MPSREKRTTPFLLPRLWCQGCASETGSLSELFPPEFETRITECESALVRRTDTLDSGLAVLTIGENISNTGILASQQKTVVVRAFVTFSATTNLCNDHKLHVVERRAFFPLLNVTAEVNLAKETSSSIRTLLEND